MVLEEECLLCSETLEKEKEGKRNYSLKNQIRSVFILRKILEISPSTCSNLLLRTQNNPSTWFSCCWECFATVIEAERIFSELTKLETKWKKLKISLEAKVLDSSRQETSRSRRSKRQNCEILQIIRQEAAKRIELVSDRAEYRHERVENLSPGEIKIPDSDAGECDPLKIEQDEYIKLEDFEFDDELLPPDFNFQQSSPISSSTLICQENVETSRGRKATLAAREENRKSNVGSSDQEIVADAEADFLPSDNSDSGAERNTKNVKTLSRARTRQKYVRKVQVGDYRCEYCPNFFTTVLKKKIHQAERHDIKHDFKCPLCSKKSSNGYNLLRHLKLVHPNKSITDLPGYGKRDVPDFDGDDGNSAAQKIVHIEMGDEKSKSPAELVCETNRKCNIVKINTATIKCDHCDILFKSTAKMRYHSRQAHGHQFQCKFCERGFPAASSLDRHVRIVHKIGEKKPKNSSIVKCGQCNKKFRHDYLKKHIETVHRNSKTIQTVNIVPATVKCDDCEKLFVSTEKMKDHANRAHGAAHQFPCKFCGKSFSAFLGLDRHVKSIHNSFEAKTKQPNHNSIVSCEECNKKMKLNFLQRHITRVHRKERNYICEKCSESFTSSTYLRYHQVKQHGDDGGTINLECKECEKKFSNPAYLKKHVERIHRKEYRYKCPICGVGIGEKNQLDRHIMMAHTDSRPHACSLCPKAYVDEAYLKRHMRTHTGERPFSCSICAKSFFNRDQLRRHEKCLHASENLFECATCQKRFPSQAYLAVHKYHAHNNRKIVQPKKLVGKDELERALSSTSEPLRNTVEYRNPTVNSYRMTLEEQCRQTETCSEAGNIGLNNSDNQNEQGTNNFHTDAHPDGSVT